MTKLLLLGTLKRLGQHLQKSRHCCDSTSQTCHVTAHSALLQVKVALCQLHVTADKDQNISTARAAIQVRVHSCGAAGAAC